MTPSAPTRRAGLGSPSSGPRSRPLLTGGAHGTRPPTHRKTRLATSPQLRIADLFAGIGGFHLAFEQVGGKCVFACENDRTARRIYEANFAPRAPELFTSERTFAGDITQVAAKDVPDHDVLTAGFPCQPFSMAGKRQGFDDQRGKHFFEIARILRAKRPRAFFLENVQGLLNHDGGQTFALIKTVLTTDLGYSLHAKVVRACDFGVPQLRPRLFMVGFRRRATKFSFPEPIPLTTTLSVVLGGHCERTVSRTLMASGDRPHGHKRNWSGYVVDGRPHRLTPQNGLALQGFPPDFILPEAYTPAMRLLGNSVAVPAVAATAREIARSLGYPVPTTIAATTSDPS